MIIRPALGLTGQIAVPGDKSISHRAVILASIAEGMSSITNFALGRDCRATVRCMEDLGVRIEVSGTTITVHGRGKRGLRRPSAELDCENSGTTMRLLTGLLAGQRFDADLTGDESLKRRPMSRIIRPLSAMGARVVSENGLLPLRITGSELAGTEYRLPEASAQVKSCVLLAGLYASGRTTVVETVPTRDHTERMLGIFGVPLERRPIPEGVSLTVEGGAELEAVKIDVPGDISSAAYFIAAAACLPRSDISITGVGLNPTRSALVEVMQNLGAKISVSGRGELSGEPTGKIWVSGGIGDNETPLRLDGPAIASLIDELPLLAVVGTQLKQGIEVRGAGELRKKESDRIEAVVRNLRSLGADAEEFEDGFRIGRSRLRGGTVDSFGDHRIAMAMAVAGLIAEGEIEILGSDIVNISFPGFFEALERAAVRPGSVL